MTAAHPKIAVLGAGIVGAALAYHLALRGASVTVVERDRPGSGVTARAFAWINISHGQPAPYTRLRQEAIEDYRRLERDGRLGLAIDWCGALSWTADPADTERFLREHRARGYDVRPVERDEIAALEPGLIRPPPFAAFAPGEGAVDPVAATAAFIRGARDAGAETRTATKVLEILTHDGAVAGLRTDEGTIACDTVVLAAGTGSGGLLAPLGLDLPVGESPAILLRFRSAGPLVKRIVSSPAMEIRQAARDVLLGAADYIDDFAGNGPGAVAARVLGAVRAGVRNAGDVELDAVQIGQRPMPSDGLPIIGSAPGIAGLYVAVMHAGITLAPAVGRLAAAEILDGAKQKILTPYRWERFRMPHGS
jgi:glycine/D-amino acid oxidase-like deaminating enzyme